MLITALNDVIISIFRKNLDMSGWLSWLGKDEKVRDICRTILIDLL